MLGRTTELGDLARLLTDPAVRLLTLLGTGGIGKTRLALEAAARQVAHFPQGVYLVELAGADSADALIPLIAERLDFTFHERGTPQQQLCDYLRPKTVLLVLDNFEHLLDNRLAPEADSVGPSAGLVAGGTAAQTFGDLTGAAQPAGRISLSTGWH
ncbi:MAG: hypothetical protein HC933_06945 [Pleurocapsa sp. SU_196_0]|nr:hypothetical protein [Pleurocapsa sp. SU_196_0]